MATGEIISLNIMLDDSDLQGRDGACLAKCLCVRHYQSFEIVLAKMIPCYPEYLEN